MTINAEALAAKAHENIDFIYIEVRQALLVKSRSGGSRHTYLSTLLLNHSNDKKTIKMLKKRLKADGVKVSSFGEIKW